MAEPTRRQPGEDERFCAECGEIVNRADAVCGNCGAALNPTVNPTANPSVEAPRPVQAGTGMDPNIAAALSYLLTWLTGLIFLLIEKDSEYVRFHAKQAIVFGVASIAVWFGLFIFFFIVAFIPIIGAVIAILGWITFTIGFFVLWILLMVKAYQGQRFTLPILGDIAEKLGPSAAQ